MSSSVKSIQPLGDYRLRLTFGDGVVGNVDLRDRIVGRGGVFAPLEDQAFFQRARINPDFETVEWPNGVDFCPDVLYSVVTGAPIPFAQSENQNATKGRNVA